MSSTPGPAMNADINVTPFLDVLLVLIIVFLASLTARKTMDVQLPVPCGDICAGSDRVIVLEILAQGRYLLNRQAVAADELLPTLRRVYDGRPEKILQVAGHRGARYQDVLTGMDVARSAGVRVISIPPSDSYDTR